MNASSNLASVQPTRPVVQVHTSRVSITLEWTSKDQGQVSMAIIELRSKGKVRSLFKEYSQSHS